MKLEEKLQALRRQHGYSQEALADRLNIARQTVSKWETAQAVPELGALIALSDLYGVAIDSLVREDGACGSSLPPREQDGQDALATFLVRAKQRTYAGKGREIAPSRTASHDFAYQEGELSYYDTYLGGEAFAGEEAVWRQAVPVWGMNYAGRVTGQLFSGDFLKEALLRVPPELPLRGPQIFTQGDYRYHCRAEGNLTWFHGREEIFYREALIYECLFHGGAIR